MTIKEAERILNTETSAEVIFGYESEDDKIKVVEEACRIACEALKKQIPKKAIKSKTEKPCFCCPACGKDLWTENHHCKCGQALDWSDNYENYD